MPEPETLQDSAEAPGNLQVPGFHVGPQSNDTGELQCRRIAFIQFYLRITILPYVLEARLIAMTLYNNVYISLFDCI